MSQSLPCDPCEFDIASLADEIRADQHCQELLKAFYLDMLEQEALPPEEASSLAYGASYFLREYVIGDRRENLLRLSPRRVRQFAGNWYIVKNLEPNLTELGEMLCGVQAFYAYCHKLGQIDAGQFEAIRDQCRQLDYYQQRIDSFWAIEGDGYTAWERDCSLRDD